MGIGAGIAFAVEHGLPLAHHAQHLIVKDHRNDGQLIAYGGAALVEIHVERAITRKVDHPLVFAQRHLRADGCAVAIAHGAQAAAG